MSTGTGKAARTIVFVQACLHFPYDMPSHRLFNFIEKREVAKHAEHYKVQGEWANSIRVTFKISLTPS
uniref:Uncharacterized protein n=1 Tax=Anguilla anguilla TaxID=7936 RepID=A0A0E9SWD5_ANGAN